MQIINIESQTFEAMLSKFEGFSAKVEALCERHAKKELSDWLDSQDVCLLLNISKRNLQTLRDTGKISFSRIGHKIYYKPEDVEKVITQ